MHEVGYNCGEFVRELLDESPNMIDCSLGKM